MFGSLLSMKKGVDSQQKSDDLSNYTTMGGILRIRSSKCENTSSLRECLEQCFKESQFYNLELSKPHSQISERLADSAKSLFDESEKLLLIAEEMHNQDPMNF
ncbi:hypothetical protein [Wolbachia endosymbiont of Aedes albopictus]|uniref:hypothetical protein n=1 Tax=Wolbachia endosymbiont of Aedes albopictus TaxID=167957 RepID=UPI000BBCB289|nr:hypothetical protein [Wolbachia endosymbiont of Aedes albopictus]UVW83462.1 hypothetical protein NHG98_03680 [Wolbachia endosymbiont of Aedes albopictus]